MNSKLKWILVLCGLVILIGAAYMAYDKLAPMVEDMRTAELTGGADSEENASSDVADESTANEESSEIVMAVDFIMYDAEGNAVHLFDLLDKPIIMNFWASTCGPCQSEMPHFQKAYEEYSDEYNFVFVNYLGFYGETEEDALEYLADIGFTFPTYFDRNQVGAYAYGIYSIPCTAFISTEGEFLGGVQGAMSEDALEYYIEEFLG